MTLQFKLEQDELAARLGGGLPSASLCLIEGGSGSGKSVVAQRLTFGLLANGHRVVYVSTEFTTPAFLDQMERLGYPVLEPFATQRLRFVPTRPLVGHALAAPDLLPRLLQAKRLLREDVVIVDDFSQLLEPHLSDNGVAMRIGHLVRSLKQINATGTTIVLTMDPGQLAGADLSPLINAADVRLECVTERAGGHVDRYIVPRKYTRAGGAVGDVIPFRVEQGAGFIVEIRAVA